MKAMLAGFVGIFVVAILVNLGLGQMGFSSSDRFSSESTRLGAMQ